MPQQYLRDDLQRNSSPAGERRRMPAEIMRRQRDPDLFCCLLDKSPCPGVAEPEDALIWASSPLGNVPLKPFSYPERHEGHLWAPTLWESKGEFPSLHTSGGQREDLTDPKAAPGLQLQE